MKIKIGMVDLKGENHFGDNRSGTLMVLIEEEYDNEYLVRWGKVVKGVYITPTNSVISKDRVYNIKERNISKFKMWCYKYWDNNFK